MDVERGTNLEAAQQLIERALALEPSNGAYVDSLGWCYYQRGWLDQAIEQLERAATLLDTDPAIFDHLGDAHFKRGDLEQARAAWQKAVELDPKMDATVRKLERLIKSEAP